MLTGVIGGAVVLIVSGVLAVHALGRPTMDNRACHAAPRKPYTTADAHMVWQARAGCDSRVCADKAAALDALIEAREPVPSPEYLR